MSMYEYKEDIERYMRSIWDASDFPDLEQYEKMIGSLYDAHVKIPEAANKVIDQVQADNADPVIEAILDELFRHEAEQKEKIRRRRKR